MESITTLDCGYVQYIQTTCDIITSSFIIRSVRLQVDLQYHIWPFFFAIVRALELFSTAKEACFLYPANDFHRANCAQRAFDTNMRITKYLDPVSSLSTNIFMTYFQLLQLHINVFFSSSVLFSFGGNLCVDIYRGDLKAEKNIQKTKETKQKLKIAYKKFVLLSASVVLIIIDFCFRQLMPSWSSSSSPSLTMMMTSTIK